ncbi:hypothetical protein BO83DRAFT_404251 [Aspergillus eucalypticola CBS 122712]|uniref:Uncharacterized protein n=1 Tax=Aspergillus eucalypticola (strain CBS 122712 / IBT 29274) TaxID=1448314 RepID=A0A317UMX8_ASPEC|nr:uncharacterized protein BO83DRAFT_404251 [Aspergillus eucalypticola CBS 122712]PWY61892.1 hypothetical protein BO83DRAFT_404251 [Aspergillus eucalypticola CBS 122712]
MDTDSIDAFSLHLMATKSQTCNVTAGSTSRPRSLHIGRKLWVSFQQRQYLEGASRAESINDRATVLQNLLAPVASIVCGEFVNRAPRSGIADIRTVRTGQVPGFDGCKGEKYQLQKSGARASCATAIFLKPHSSRQVRNRPSRKVEHEYSDMAFCTGTSSFSLGAIQVPGPGTRLLGRVFILACPSPSAGWTLIVDNPCTIGGRPYPIMLRTVLPLVHHLLQCRSIGVIPDQMRPALFLDLTAPDRDRASMDLPQFAYVVAPVINSPYGPRIGNPNCGNQQAATGPRSGLGLSPPTLRRNSEDGRCIYPPQPGSWT